MLPVFSHELMSRLQRRVFVNTPCFAAKQEWGGSTPWMAVSLCCNTHNPGWMADRDWQLAVSATNAQPSTQGLHISTTVARPGPSYVGGMKQGITVHFHDSPVGCRCAFIKAGKTWACCQQCSKHWLCRSRGMCKGFDHWKATKQVPRFSRAHLSADALTAQHSMHTLVHRPCTRSRHQHRRDCTSHFYKQ